jgi:hypothetical protein
MANLLTAVQTIIQNYNTQLSSAGFQANRMNAMGVALEDYVKDAFANSFNTTISSKQQTHQNVFSYLGNANNPPDMMLKGGDAIEVKKLEGLNNAIALNSSYPKDKLYASSPMITDDCRRCESWSVKDLLYAIGTVKNKTNLSHLWLVYGDCFVADSAVYERIRSMISSGVQCIQNVLFTPTKELGKVKKVDPLGITDLRIRGMWSIENPTKVFAGLHSLDPHATFQLSCIVRTDKFLSFPQQDRDALLLMRSSNFTITNIHIKNPNNPAVLIEATLLYFKV